MKYSPKRTDSLARAVYAALLIFTVLGAGSGSGITKTILSSLSIITLTAALYLFIRYELTSYVYILRENNNISEFYVDKYIGKRGGYVCFYPISDSVYFGKYEKDTKKGIKEKYRNVRFYNYSQNVFRANKSVIVFENTGYYDAVIFEPDNSFSDMIGKATEQSFKNEGSLPEQSADGET